MTYNPMWQKLNELKMQPAAATEKGQEQTGGQEKPKASVPPSQAVNRGPTVAPPNPGAGAPRNPINTAPPARGSFQPPGALQLPAGYLQNGYFDAAKHIHKELLVEHAREVARVIGMRQDRAEGIKNAQLRKFYGHVKTAESRLNYGVSFEEIRPKVLELSAFVAEAQGKGKVPLVFKEFMDINLSYVVDGPSFRDGFVKHFQAVVGFFSFYYRD